MTDSGMDKHESRCLILFAREPRAGQVKSRLVPALGEQGTLAFYQRLLSHQIDLVNSFQHANVQLWVDGNPGHEDFGNFRGEIHRQQGADLGERMYQALCHGLSAHDAAVLIGCDCPWLDIDYLDKAFIALEQGHDAVFGPALDGGYVLVGLNRVCHGIFRDVAWGQQGVMEQTRAHLHAMAMNWQELPALHDIDEPGDLAMLATDDNGNWLI